MDGVISYSDPTLGENTVATHTCEAGSALTTDITTRTCGVTSGGVGVWSGSPLVCAGMGSPNTVPTILIISQGVPVQTPLIYKMDGSATALYQLIATDELLLWPPTSEVVPLAWKLAVPQ